ncbi:hypothetical protein [Paraferrimonas sp. SM1919]|uniref:hypothetical protein n=1 Tax=Paraferrimonas sp. SM1919 TaxID=2662263 RepID=UPI0013D1E526|nr:hypothetical protein [Paraferrimonas sp. SM1919]
MKLDSITQAEIIYAIPCFQVLSEAATEGKTICFKELIDTAQFICPHPLLKQAQSKLVDNKMKQIIQVLCNYLATPNLTCLIMFENNCVAPINLKQERQAVFSFQWSKIHLNFEAFITEGMKHISEVKLLATQITEKTDSHFKQRHYVEKDEQLSLQFDKFVTLTNCHNTKPINKNE